MVRPRTESRPDTDCKLNLNLASRRELLNIDGMTPETVDRIVRYREAYGRFRRIEEIDEIGEFQPDEADTLKRRTYV
ncbi:MAG: ComEA family DNA-binding protein [Phycisphaeraceae bacterium]